MRLFYLLLLLSAFPTQARILGEYIAVNPHALPGDSDANHLGLPGLRIHETNDYFGDTDKLITGGGSATLTRVWRHFSTSLSFKGLFIMPIMRTRNDQPKLNEKIGVYGESIETNWQLSYTHYRRNSLGYKFNFGVGYADIGDHGLVNLYQQIHEKLGDPVENDEFGDKLKESFMTVNYGAAVIFPLLKTVNFMVGTSVYNSRAFYEYALETSIVVSLSRKFALSMKYMFIDQKSSGWYDLKPNRQQYIMALRISEYWTPSLMIVSPFVKGDDYGQIYLSPISFTLPF